MANNINGIAPTKRFTAIPISSAGSAKAYPTTRVRVQRDSESKEKDEAKKAVSSAGNSGQDSAAKSLVRSRMGLEEIRAQHELQTYADGMHPDQVAARDARSQFEDKQRQDTEKARWRNTTAFAKEATSLEPDKNGVITFKDASTLSGVVDGFSPVEQVTDPESGLSTFQNKKVQGRWVSQGPNRAPKLHLFHINGSGIEEPLKLPNGGTVTPDRDALLAMSQINGMYSTETEMQVADKERAAAKAATEEARRPDTMSYLSTLHEQREAIINSAEARDLETGELDPRALDALDDLDVQIERTEALMGLDKMSPKERRMQEIIAEEMEAMAVKQNSSDELDRDLANVNSDINSKQAIEAPQGETPEGEMFLPSGIAIPGSTKRSVKKPQDRNGYLGRGIAIPNQ